MTRLATIISIGWLSASCAWAQLADHEFSALPIDAIRLANADMFSPLPMGIDPRQSNGLSDSRFWLSSYFLGRVRLGIRAVSEHQVQTESVPIPGNNIAGRNGSSIDVVATYALPAGNTVFGYIGLPGEPALGPPASYMRRYAGIDDPDAAMDSQWRDASRSGARIFTAGYSWRNVKLEGSAFSATSPEDHKPARQESSKLESRSARLSFNPAPNWAFQISRGTVSGLDQLVPDDNVRRTTISATYSHAFGDGNWQTTLAWGRNARKFHETTMGYLLESTLRFYGMHAMFSRVEQVSSDELLRENESLERKLFKMNKVTLGYYQEVRPSGGFGFDAGVLISRYLIPSSMAEPYGKDPTAYMIFLRLKIQ